MKVKITSEINDGNTRIEAGQYIETTDEVARDWIAFGLAVDASEVPEENLVEVNPDSVERGAPTVVEDEIVEIAPVSDEPSPAAKKAPAKKAAARPRKES